MEKKRRDLLKIKGFYAKKIGFQRIENEKKFY